MTAIVAITLSLDGTIGQARGQTFQPLTNPSGAKPPELHSIPGREKVVFYTVVSEGRQILTLARWVGPPSTSAETISAERPTDLSINPAQDVSQGTDFLRGVFLSEEARACCEQVRYGNYAENCFVGASVAAGKRQTLTQTVDDSPLFVALSQHGREARERFPEEYRGDVEQAAPGETARRQVLGHVRRLVAAGKLAVEARGDGLSSLKITVRNLTREELEVWIIPGLYFVPSSAEIQTMVVMERKRLVLQAEESTTVTVAAACASRTKHTPSSSNVFTLGDSSQPELERIGELAEERHCGRNVIQAAVWIVTDDADFEDLGSLRVLTLPVLAIVRAIGPVEAAEAMRICHDAGVDIKRKAIWRDRHAILAELPDGELKSWLEKMIEKP